MSHDHEAVSLAVAALDFDLSPDEYARVQAGLRECLGCAEAVASHQEMARLLELLPTRDASPYVRERVLRAALVPPRQRPWPLLLVAAALLGLLLAAGVAVGAFREQPTLESSVVIPSASAPAHGDGESPAPSTSPAPGSSEIAQGPAGPQRIGAPMSPDSLAEVVSGRLRIRSEPRVADDSIKFEPLLDVGDRLLVIEGPVVANDYEWYRVVAWRPHDPSRSWPDGWVARGDHDGSPWVRPRPDACPTGAITIDSVVALRAEERVACFGDRRLRIRAFVFGEDRESCMPEPGFACTDGPAWLTAHGGWEAQSDVFAAAVSTAGLRLAIEPNGPLARSVLPSEGLVDLEGAFDHPAAQQCRPGPAGQGTEAITAVLALLECRAQFVVKSIRSNPAYPVRDARGITVSDNLRVRSDPGLAGERYELLDTGTEVWVVDGPVVRADYEWFQVIVSTVDAGDGSPRVGWVAASNHGGEPWLARRDIDCTSAGSVTVADLMALTGPGYGDGGLACYGSAKVRFHGTIGMSCGIEDHPGWEMTPDWLSGNASAKLAIRDRTAFVVAVPRPGLALPVSCGQADATTYVLEGHFDDEESGTCEATMPGGRQAPDVDQIARYWCRTTLVIDGLAPEAPTAAIPGVTE